jgi:hypothetical protein
VQFLSLLVEVVLPITKTLVEMMGGRGHEGSGPEGGARAPDPVLATAQFAGRFVILSPSHGTKKDAVKLGDEAGGNGELFHPGQAFLEGSDMIGDLDNGLSHGRIVGFDLEQEQFVNLSVSVFDEGTENGFAAKEGPDEQVGVGQEASCSAEFRDRAVGFGQKSGEAPVHREIGGSGGGIKA